MDFLQGSLPSNNFSSQLSSLRGQSANISGLSPFINNNSYNSGFNFSNMINSALGYLNPFNSMLGSIGNTVSGIGGLRDGIKSLFGSHSAERRQVAYQKQLMDYSANIQKELLKQQNDWNIESWNMQNEYNSPSAQMQRLRDAGLNPNLMYSGNGSVAEASPISSGSGVSLASSTDAGAYPFLSSQVDIQRFAAIKQAELLDSQIHLNESAADKNFTEAGLAPSLARSSIRVDQSKVEEAASRIRSSFVYNNWLASDSDLKHVEYLIKNSGKDYLLGALEEQYYQLWNSNRLAKQLYNFNESANPKRLEEIQATVSSIYQGIKESKQRIETLVSQAGLNDAQASWLRRCVKEAEETFEERLEGLKINNQIGREESILKVIQQQMGYMQNQLLQKNIDTYTLQQAVALTTSLLIGVGSLRGTGLMPMNTYQVPEAVPPMPRIGF